MVFEFIQNNFIGATIVVFLIMFISTNNNFDKRTNNLFFAAACCVLLLIVEENWEAQLALHPVFTSARISLSALGYSLRPIIPYLLILTIKKYNRKQAALLGIPLAINALVSFSALFCGLAFSYTVENEFVRGPLGMMPFVVAGLYVVLLLALTLRVCRDGGLMEAMIVSAIVLLAFIATLLESIFGFRYIQNPSMATSITFYYLFLHSMRNNRDQLTGALTRRRFYHDAEKSKMTLSAIISVDINGLKKLNDEFGHVAGDKALVSITEVIKKHMNARVRLYRIGGDEFMILCNKLSKHAVRELIEKIQIDLENTEFRCAMGYSMYAYPMMLDEACHIADNNMYQNKREMKQIQCRLEMEG